MVQAGWIVMLKALVGLPLASVALTVKLELAAPVGVPLMTPVEAFRLKCAGKDPEMTEKLGLAQPAVPIVCEYAMFTVPLGRLLVVMLQPAFITMLSGFVGFPLASVTATVKLEVAAVVGVPEIVPLEDPIERLAGNDPAEMLKLGAAQPAVATVWE